jgi:hypothetical protein
MLHTHDSCHGFCQACGPCKMPPVKTDHLYFGVLAITALFALILVVYFAIKERGGIAWSVIPFCVSIGILVWTLIVFFHNPAQNTSPK